MQYKPKRGPFEWSTTDDGRVHITVPKFTSKVGIRFCKTLKRENTFTAHLDALGSLVWNHCDGSQTIEQILDLVTKEFSDEKNIDQRLFLFIQQLKSLSYITY